MVRCVGKHLVNMHPGQRAGALKLKLFKKAVPLFLFFLQALFLPHFEVFAKDSESTSYPSPVIRLTDEEVDQADREAAELMEKIINGGDEKADATLLRVMKAYDELQLVRTEAGAYADAKAQEIAAAKRFDSETETRMRRMIYDKWVHEKKVFYKAEDGTRAEFMSASHSRVMPYAHIINGLSSLAYIVIDVNHFAGEKLSPEELLKSTELDRLKDIAHVNEGDENERGRPAGRNVILVMIDSNRDFQVTGGSPEFADRRIVSMHSYLKPSPFTLGWLKSFHKYIYSGPTKQDWAFGAICGLAQTGLAVGLGVAKINLGVDADGVIDTLPAAFSMGFGTVVGAFARSYARFTNWGNIGDRWLKSSMIGLIFAYSIATLNGLDPIFLDAVGEPLNPAHYKDFAKGIWGNLGKMFAGAAGIAALVGVHAHIFINNAINGRAKVAVHEINRGRARSGLSIKPFEIPENVLRKFFLWSAKFTRLKTGQLLSAVGQKVKREASYLGIEAKGSWSKTLTHQMEDYRQKAIKGMDSAYYWSAEHVSLLLPGNRRLRTNLLQDQVEYQANYMGHFFWKLADLTGVRVGSAASGISITKLLFVSIIPLYNWIAIVSSRARLAHMQQNNLNWHEYKSYHDELEARWADFKEYFHPRTAPRKIGEGLASLPSNVARKVVGTGSWVKGSCAAVLHAAKTARAH